MLSAVDAATPDDSVADWSITRNYAQLQVLHDLLKGELGSKYEDPTPFVPMQALALENDGGPTALSCPRCHPQIN